MLFRSIPVPPLMTNCYLLGDEETKLCCLVDPGGAAAKLIQETRSAGYTLAAILLTHGHYDHTTGVSEILKEFPDIPVYIHDKELLADGCLDRNFFMAKTTTSASSRTVIPSQSAGCLSRSSLPPDTPPAPPFF